MEGLLAVSMIARVGEQQHEGSSNSSSVLSMSVTEGHGEGARVQKKRKGAGEAAKTKKRRQDRSATWLKEETEKLLQAYPQISQDKGRFRRTSACDESFWVAVSQEVQGRSWKECQRRMDTLTKSWKAINKKKLTQLDEKMLQGMKLATAMTVGWYNQMCEIKKKTDNARVVSTETCLVEEGEQSNGTSPVFAPGRLVTRNEGRSVKKTIGCYSGLSRFRTHALAAPGPHQQDLSRDFRTLQSREAPKYSSGAGEDEELHQLIPCPGAAALGQALVPGALDVAVVPPAPRSPKPHQDAYSSPQPAVDKASSDLDVPSDFATEAVGSVPCLEVVRDVGRINSDLSAVDTSSLPPTEFDDVPSVEDLVDFDLQDPFDMDYLFDKLQFGLLPGF